MEQNKQYPGTNAIGVSREGLIILRLPQKEPLAIATFKGKFSRPLFVPTRTPP